MNTCLVCRRSGGLRSGATYSGPIGLIIDPTFNARKCSILPCASSLNGSCSNVCPVEINIHEPICAWRGELLERHEVPAAKQAAMKAAGRAAVGAHRLPRPDRRRRYGARPSAEVRHLQRPERLGKAPRVAALPQTDLPQPVRREPGSEAMSNRDDILVSIRTKPMAILCL
jgi:L-lactate dehydrogenase complex protein LldF